MSCANCFHCGEPVPDAVSLIVTIDGEDQPVCCIGCQAVARLIVDADLSAFYRTRTAYSPTPDDNNQHVIDWFKDEDWLASFSHQEDGSLQIPLLVHGMSCAACSWVIETRLKQHLDVIAVDINLSLSRVVIAMTKGANSSEAISELTKLGYGVRPWRTNERLSQLASDRKRDLRRLGVAGVGMMQVGMSAIALHAGDLQGIDTSLQQLLRSFSAPLTVFVLLYSGRSFFINAWLHIKQGSLIMDSSVSLALGIATVASLWATVTGYGDTYYDSVVMFIFFLLLARFTEKRLRDADLVALAQVEDSLPEFVNTLRGDIWQRVPRQHIVKGDSLRVVAGEAIAFDGDIIAGESAVEESVFTGESLPRQVKRGDRVFAGTVNRDASLDLRVRANPRDSRLAVLANDVERARKEKPPFIQLIDKIASRFVVGVLAAALGTAIFWLWLEPAKALWSALAVLVVACPCALSLATPAAMAAAIARLRGKGIAAHGEFGLLAAAEASHVLIDKTGTLTSAQLAINAVLSGPTITQAVALELAAALQQFSHHPAARVFHDHTSQQRVEQIAVVPGAGIEGCWYRGSSAEATRTQVRIGSLQFCRERCPELTEPPDDDHYWIGLVGNHEWLAWIGLSETLKEESVQAVTALKALGLGITILSGDTHDRVEAVATQLNLPFSANCQPGDKLDILQALQVEGHRVVAVGDGLNDAPFLGGADASIAVADATALAKAQADFVVTKATLLSVPIIIEVARSARRVMRQNLIWAGGYNLIGIPFAAMGYVPPWLAAVGMSFSSLVVVLNALRLRKVTLHHE